MRHLTTMRHIACIILALTLAAASAEAIDLTTYYSKTKGKKGADLKTALYNTISSHTNIGYDGLLEAYKTTDCRDDGYLRDWYSNATNFVIGGSAENHAYKVEGDGYNREHLVPQSWFGSGLMKSDLVQVVPTDGYVNNRRSNHPLGENNGGVYKSQNGYSKVGACTVSGYTGTCFEPNDEVKGDIARVYFYVLACYQNLHPNWNGGSASQVFDGKTYPGLKSWALQMFLRWAKADPVDDVERARNEAVYSIQKNRNPFVDYPSLCDYVWGDSVAYAFDPSLPHGQSPIDNTGGGDDDQGQGGGSQGGGSDDGGGTGGDDGGQGGSNKDAASGTIDLTSLTWTAASHPTYGTGFTATANGLTLAYYQASSPVTPVSVNANSELRFYDKSVFIISGAEITGVTFHDGGGSKSGCAIVIEGTSRSFSNGQVTWEGSMNPFIATASKQSRIKIIDVTVRVEEEEVVSVSTTAINAFSTVEAVYDLSGRYVGHTLPLRAGTYLVRRGGTAKKYVVK